MLKFVQNLYIVLKKGHNAQQEGKLDYLKKTYPNLKLIDHYEFGKLFHPDIFPEKNKARLYREVTQKILQSFSDFHYGFSRLPDSYKAKILTSREFDDFMSVIELFAKSIDSKQKEKPEKLFSFVMYYNFFVMGLEGLIEVMPDEFKYHLREQVRNVLHFMQSLADYEKKLNPKSRTPFIHAPKTIQNTGTIDTLR